jgi:hypothetical protein
MSAAPMLYMLAEGQWNDSLNGLSSGLSYDILGWSIQQHQKKINLTCK